MDRSLPSCTPAKKLTDFRFVNLFSTDVSNANGTHPWIFASRKQIPGADAHRPDAVLIIAVVQGADGRPRLVLTREFRAPLGAIEISVPSGLVDADEDVVEAARRELFEETGLTLGRVAQVSRACASSAGLTDETVAFVYAEASGTFSREHLEAHEHIDAALFAVEELRELLREPSGPILSSRVYPILAAFVQAGAIVLPQS